MGVPNRAAFQGWSAAADALEACCGKDDLLTRSEVVRVSGISNARFGMLRNSVLFRAVYPDAELVRRGSLRGTASQYRVGDLVRLLRKLATPKAQALVIADGELLSDERFEGKYGRTKEEVFDGSAYLFESYYPEYEVGKSE